MAAIAWWRAVALACGERFLVTAVCGAWTVFFLVCAPRVSFCARLLRVTCCCMWCAGVVAIFVGEGCARLCALVFSLCCGERGVF